MSADTSTASTPVSNPIACTAATGVGRGGDEGRSNIDGDLGNSHACVCIICSQDIYMHFKNPVPDFKSENTSAIGGVEVRHRPAARCRE